MRSDVVAQLSDYRGALGWYSFTDGQSNVRPYMEIELFIKEYPIPYRKPKITEVNTLSNLDSQGYDASIQAIFWGSPEPLQVNMNGWLITPYEDARWKLKDKFGNNVFTSQNMTYGDVISAYIEGRLNLSSKGAFQRKDPDYFISPHGQQYSNPVITVWEPSYSVHPMKTPFSMTILLER